MKDNFLLSFWSDNFCVDGNDIWCIDAVQNYLYHIDDKKNEFIKIVKIPNEKKGGLFRSNPQCIKYHNDIFCLPDHSNIAWVYNIDSESFGKIEIENPNNVRHAIDAYIIRDTKLFLFSKGLAQIIEIDASKKVIEQYYTVCDLKNYEIVNNYVLNNQKILILAKEPNRIYEFDVINKECKKFELDQISKPLMNLVCEKDLVWFGGKEKEIYIFNQNSKEIITLNKFPREFKSLYKDVYGIEKNYYGGMLFSEVAETKEYMWFFPYYGNHIIYINKKSYDIKTFDVKKKYTDKMYVNKKSDYKVCYVRDKRYIGIVDTDEYVTYEIDAEKLNIHEKKFQISESIFLEGPFHNIMYENGSLLQKEIMAIKFSIKNDINRVSNCGYKIYSML